MMLQELQQAVTVEDALRVFARWLDERGERELSDAIVTETFMPWSDKPLNMQAFVQLEERAEKRIDEAWKDGEEEGYARGHEDGHTEGYDEGYTDAMEEYRELSA